MLSLLAAAALALSPEAAGKPSPTPPRPPSGQIFRFRLPFEPATLDWTLGDVPINVVRNVMRGLYRLDEDGAPAPDLASEAQASPNGLTWTLGIREGIQWSDGAAFTARHAADGLKRLAAPETGSSYSFLLAGLRDARALDDHRLEITLERPMPYLPGVLTHWATYPVRLDLIAVDRRFWQKADGIPALGPYRVLEYQPQTRVVMAPNPRHSPVPGFRRVEAWVVTDDATALNLYRTGHLEFMTDPGETGATAEPDVRFIDSPVSIFLGIGPGHPLTSSRAGILALSAALDRTQLPKALAAPHRPALDYCPPETWASLGDAPEGTRIDTIPLAGAPTLARELLKDAGFPDPAKVPPLKLRYYERPATRLLAQWLQGQWQSKLGLRVSLEGAEPKVYWRELAARPAHLFLNSKGASFPDVEAFFSLFSSRNPQNLGHWADAGYDKLVLEAATAKGEARRRALYAQAARILQVTKPGVIPLYHRASAVMVKPFVKDMQIDSMGAIDLSGAKY